MEEVMLLMSYGSLEEVEKFMLNNCGNYCLLPLEVVEGHLRCQIIDNIKREKKSLSPSPSEYERIGEKYVYGWLRLKRF
jgi:hypothetical protein